MGLRRRSTVATNWSKLNGFVNTASAPSRVYCAEIHSRILRSRDADDREARSELPQFSNGFDIILFGHHDVRNNHGRRLFSARVMPRFRSWLRRFYDRSRQSFGHNVVVARVIIDQEDLGHLGSPADLAKARIEL